MKRTISPGAGITSIKLSYFYRANLLYSRKKTVFVGLQFLKSKKVFNFNYVKLQKLFAQKMFWYVQIAISNFEVLSNIKQLIKLMEGVWCKPGDFQHCQSTGEQLHTPDSQSDVKPD